MYYKYILIFNTFIMSTISVPLDAKHMEHLKFLQEQTGASPAAVMRKALERAAEDKAVNDILVSEQEIAEGKILRGDIHTILTS